MQILSLDSVDSTQRYLLDALKKGKHASPVCVTARHQESGRGSRGNSWSGLDGNLFFSFSISRRDLPNDLKLESSSIYFTYILKELLAEMGSSLWLKWPNDFYLDDKKIGGAITNLYKDELVCGIGLNTKVSPEGFSKMDIEIENATLLRHYMAILNNPPSWKKIFSKYEIEFVKSKRHFTHSGDTKLSLENARLLDDGSIECDGQRIFSLR
ncbi:MAG: biotin--[acetyl-CoA-carboxylase] ligase [Helicobacteraceae bacterium]|nr:biotin--[acetyl-CoA-carboxylase] ligase [Helicobacteraceae bacterium]